MQNEIKSKKQKDQGEERTYALKPATIKDKFLHSKIYKILREVIDLHLIPVDKYKHDDINNINKKICDDVKLRLKDQSLNIKRYKVLVHCIIGEKKGQGIRMGNKCLWDTNTDSMVTAHYENEILFCVVSCFGVYFY